MWKGNEDGQRINRENTHMNVKLKIPDREATTKRREVTMVALINAWVFLILSHKIIALLQSFS